MSVMLRLLQAAAMIALDLYAMHAFGVDAALLFMLLPAAAIGTSALMGRSPSLDRAGIVLSRVTGVLAGLAAALLLVAGSIGGSFHLSGSNQVVLLGLGAVAVPGLAGFAFRLPRARQ